MVRNEYVAFARRRSLRSAHSLACRRPSPLWRCCWSARVRSRPPEPARHMQTRQLPRRKLAVHASRASMPLAVSAPPFVRPAARGCKARTSPPRSQMARAHGRASAAGPPDGRGSMGASSPPGCALPLLLLLMLLLGLQQHTFPRCIRMPTIISRLPPRARRAGAGPCWCMSWRMEPCDAAPRAARHPRQVCTAAAGR